MMMRSALFGLMVLVGLSASVSVRANDEFRHTVRIVGSSTVFPFAAFVAERYYRQTGKNAPVVESTGSGGGIKMFCGGVGAETPDIVNASRRMKVSEISLCANNKVHDITEIMVGWDGIILATSVDGKAFGLTRQHLWKALAKRLPVDGQLLDNPHKLWSHIDPELPAVPIQVFGPPPTSGTRDVFVEEVMIKGCRGSSYVETLPEETRRVACGEMREDGVYVEAGEDDDLVVRRLKNNPKAFGIMGYNALERRSNLITAVTINGVAPSYETIQDGEYPLARPLFLYVKDEHLIALPTIQNYVDEFISPQALGEEGYLADNGLIPLKGMDGRQVKAQITKLTAQ
ncbi:substrate-binding domain-containing protein [Terasakiella pusilla]|uniref:substrate-binding domain-containing protein n=1 Tax=Terasakiella pusilla TaxID=64973 RepID=UPI003AA839C0